MMTDPNHVSDHSLLAPGILCMQDLLLSSAGHAPASVAVKSPDQTWSYERLLKRSRQYAQTLSLAGIVPGERVALLMENGPEYVAAYFGVFLAGAVAVPLDVKAQPAWLSMVLTDSEVAVLVTFPQQVRKMMTGPLRCVVTPSATLGPVPPQIKLMDADSQPCSEIDFRPDPSSPAVINYTSGSSGQPKGVVMSHRAILANTRSIATYLGLHREDRVMQILPFSYCYGASLLHTHFMVGGTVVIDNRFQYPSAVLGQLKRSRCTGFAGVPSTFHTLAARCVLRGSDYPHLRYVTQAGGRMEPDLVDAVREAIAPARLFVMYGQTEASARLTYLDPDRWLEKRGSVGRPIPGVALKVVQEDGAKASAGVTGEIWASGENLMNGYWRQPDETARVLVDGWLRTGDLGHVDADGFLYIKGRVRDLIKCHGYRISPAEIEVVVKQHPAIYDAVILGLPDPQCGEVVCVVLALKQGTVLSDEELKRHCRQHLPPIKVPRRILKVEQLPRSWSGKLQKEALLKLFA
ncbi:MAG: acyl--CoA ligase [Acidobacteria bacterium]|nr:acyl--CoA ligase [Acidobacteriota bacterium]MCI0718379.1 acyl--CoA ligase [Acidobacteriota bacterium]